VALLPSCALLLLRGAWDGGARTATQATLGGGYRHFVAFHGMAALRTAFERTTAPADGGRMRSNGYGCDSRVITISLAYHHSALYAFLHFIRHPYHGNVRSDTWLSGLTGDVRRWQDA